MLLNVLLYGLLGAVLAYGGISIVETPLKFALVLLSVIIIDVRATYTGRKLWK